LDTPHSCPDHGDETVFDTSGVDLGHHEGDLDLPPGVQQLSNGQTVHANGWTITVVNRWTRFTNDATGHGMALAPQNMYSFLFEEKERDEQDRTGRIGNRCPGFRAIGSR
jgi:hypothetical protein